MSRTHCTDFQAFYKAMVIKRIRHWCKDMCTVELNRNHYRFYSYNTSSHTSSNYLINPQFFFIKQEYNIHLYNSSTIETNKMSTDCVLMSHKINIFELCYFPFVVKLAFFHNVHSPFDLFYRTATICFRLL